MAERIDCEFCDLVDKPQSPFDIHESIGDGTLLKPTLGMMLPGYLLALTEEHVTSFAQLPEEQLRGIDASLSRYEESLGDKFGDYFRLEHGSDNITTCGSGGCIDHAHIHLIPADNDVGAHIQDQLPWQQLDSYEDIKDFQGKLTDYLTSRKADLIGKITKEKALSDALIGELKAAVTEFKQTYK